MPKKLLDQEKLIAGLEQIMHDEWELMENPEYEYSEGYTKAEGSVNTCELLLMWIRKGKFDL